MIVKIIQIVNLRRSKNALLWFASPHCFRARGCHNGSLCHIAYYGSLRHIAFVPAAVTISCLMHEEVLKLLYVLAHKQAYALFDAADQALAKYTYTARRPFVGAFERRLPRQRLRQKQRQMQRPQRSWRRRRTQRGRRQRRWQRR
jgi:hypothetical protein